MRFLVRRDRKRTLRFAPLDGPTAAAARARHAALPPLDETLVLVEAPGTPGERVRVRSDAALAVLARLGGVWRLAALLRLFPRPLREAVYRFVARRRRRWFGRREACRVPEPAERSRFLD